MEEQQQVISEQKEKAKKRQRGRANKDIINIIRTTQRNNIDLTHIADNKANVLLSLNALMISFMVPIVLANFSFVLEQNLSIPLITLLLTNLVTIYFATLVLKPGKIEQKKENRLNRSRHFSPFFFGNFYKMSHDEFKPYIKEALDDRSHIMDFISDDLYYVGARLGQKMRTIEIAFNIFLVGLSISLFATLIIFFIGYS